MCGVHQLSQQLARCSAGIYHAAARVKDGPFGGFKRSDKVCNCILVAFDTRLIMLNFRFVLWRVISRGELHILWNIHQNRARPTCGGNVKSLMDDIRKLSSIFNQPVMFCAGARNAHRISLLKGI